MNSFIYDDKMSPSEAVKQIEKMRHLKKIKEDYRIKKHKDGRFYVYIKRKQLIASTEEELYEKIYDKLYGIETWSMEKIFPEFLKWKNEHSAVKGITLRRYKEVWNQFFKDREITRLPLKELKSKDFVVLYTDWTKKRELTSKQFTNAKSIINGIYKYAIAVLEIVSINEAQNIDMQQFPLKQVNNDGEVFSLEDREKILEYLEDDDYIYSLAIKFAFYIPIRIGELLALKWSDIDGQRLRIKKQRVVLCEMKNDLSFTPKKYTTANQTKGFSEKGVRYIYLGRKALEILNQIPKINEYIFTNEKGQQLYPASFNRNLKKVCNKLCITPRSSHKIRFCVASMFYSKGVPITEIQRMLGHTTLQMTMHYLRDVMSDKVTENILDSL